MKFQRRFGQRKKRKATKGLFLIGLLIFVLYLFFNADAFLNLLFK